VLAPPAAYGVALAVAPLAVTAWIAALGGLRAWREIVIDYLIPVYSTLREPLPWGFHRWHAWLPVLAAIAISLGSAVVARRFGARHLVAAIGLAYGLAHYFGQGKGWEYHAYPAAAFAAILAFSEVVPLARERRATLAAAVAAALATAVVLFAVKGGEAASPEWIRQAERRVESVVADLRPRLRAGDTVQVLDTSDGGIHALLRLRLRQPTRFIYAFHFFHGAESPSVQRLRAELMRDLDRQPPAFVVVFQRDWPSGGPLPIPAFPELAAWLARHPEVARGEGYVIHAKRDRS
jgi:hypothetical protein